MWIEIHKGQVASQNPAMPGYCRKCGQTVRKATKTVRTGFDPLTGERSPDQVNEYLRCVGHESHPIWIHMPDPEIEYTRDEPGKVIQLEAKP